MNPIVKFFKNLFMSENKTTATTQAAPQATSHTSSSTQPKLYALLVGINSYPNTSRSLKGCVSDMNLVKDYLNEDFVHAQFGDVKIETLTDNGATKENIITAIKLHLGKAKHGDTAMFYFSGHGIREKTHITAFTDEEIDSNIGGLVCTDFGSRSKSNPGGTVVADKELRYLIRQLAEDEQGNPKAHVVFVLDCCHSGETTRSAIGADLPEASRQIERGAIKGREFTDFIFHKDQSILDGIQNRLPLGEILPQGDHVMLAACRDVELAWEMKGLVQSDVRNGAFTSSLVEILKQHNGLISYHELHSRVLNRMRFYYSQDHDGRNDKRQTPQFYIRTGQPTDRFNSFLSNKMNTLPTHCAVEKVDAAGEKEWRIDVGAMHGVAINQTKKPTDIQLYSANNEGKKLKVAIKKVFPTYSVLQVGSGFSESAFPEPLRAIVEGLNIRPIKIFLDGEQEGKELASSELEKLAKQTGTQLYEFASEQGLADYVILAKDGLFYTHKPFDAERPLLKPIEYREANGTLLKEKVRVLFEDIQQIAQWTFLRDLQYQEDVMPANLKSKTSMYPVELSLYIWDEEKNEESRVFPKGNKFVLDLTPENREKWIRFELENFSEQELFVSLIYQSYDFGILIDENTRPMEKAILGIGKGMKFSSRGLTKANGKDYAPVQIEEYVKKYNWPGVMDYLKLVVSATPFNVESFHMDPLPTPLAEDSTTRKANFAARSPEVPPVQWEIRTFDLDITNPDYNPQGSIIA